MKILFLVPYPLQEAPSQRFRLEQYFSSLTKKGICWTVCSFFDSQNGRIFYKSGSPFQKIVLLLGGLIKRLQQLFAVSGFDFIFVHRETAPAGPPVLEWFIAKILRKKMIYDFDDAIWLTDNINESSFERWLRCRWKVALICKWSYKVSCGNEYLAVYARQYNANVVVNPTTIDLQLVDQVLKLGNIKNPDDQVVIGWTGSHSTLKYFKTLEPVLQELEKTFANVSFRIIADHDPKLDLSRVQFIRWKKETEIEDLLPISIGLMPLPDDEWAKGKCGFKALQYMALEIPAVISPVGVNKTIIAHNQNGMLCNTIEEWTKSLAYLIQNLDARIRLGREGRKTVELRYCVDSNEANFLSFFN